MENNSGKLPKGAFIILAGEFLERFIFWGTQSFLVLYLVNVINFSSSKSMTTQASVTSISFVFSIVGGIFADRLTTPYFTLKLGSILIIFGCLTLALFDEYKLTLLGLSLFSLGAGLFIPNSPNILSSLYKKENNNREYGFVLLYFFTNLGGALSPIFYGILVKYNNWKFCFYISSIILSFWYFIFFTKLQKTFQENKKNNKNIFFTLTISFVFLYVIYFLLNHKNITGLSIAFMIFISLSYIVFQLRSIDKNGWVEISKVLFMISACMWFFSTEFQVNNSFLLFLDRMANKKIGNFEIPVPFFASLEPLFVIILAPILARFWLLMNSKGYNKDLTKITLGLFLECLGFYLMSYVSFLAIQSKGGVPFIWTLPVYFLLAAGELCIMPITISTISQVIPEKLKGTFLGFLYLSLSSSAYISGFIAVIAVGDHQGFNYYQSYLKIGHISLGIVALFTIHLLMSLSFRVKIKK